MTCRGQKRGRVVSDVGYPSGSAGQALGSEMGLVTVSPHGAVSPPWAEWGCAEGPGGHWAYSCSCHMLQVKVITPGWIPLVTKPVSVDSHS